MRNIKLGLFILALCLGWHGGVQAAAEKTQKEVSALDPKAAVAYSQAAVGRQVADYKFANRQNKPVQLSEYRGRPVVINLIYTACSDFCPTLVQTLYGAVKTAQKVFGKDKFNIISVGFDARGDTPARMRAFARSQGVDLPNWYFLSGSQAEIKALATNLGFIYYPSARGFDHMAQVSVLDRQGRVFQQIYGANFSSPALVEPLRAIYNAAPININNPLALIDRIKLFCTFYDPTRDSYSVDYSIIFSLVIGGLSLLGLATILIRALLRIHRERSGKAA